MSARRPAAAALAVGLACSVPAALPAWVRCQQGGLALRAAVVLIAAASLVVVPIGAWLRRARDAGWPRADRALACGASLSALPLALFGGVLKSTTHHRPLGGATFAVAALGTLALCVGLGFRVFSTHGDGTPKSAWRNLFTLGCGLSVVSAAALGLARAAHPSLVDFLALLMAGVVAGSVPLPKALSRLRLAVALAGWVALLVCAVLSESSPQLVRSLTTQAPVSFAPLSWLGDGS